MFQLGGEAWFVWDPTIIGEAMIINSGYEDSWFSCAGYNGFVRSVQSDGSLVDVVEGGLAHLSDDGTHLAYVRASTCGPDQVDPGNWVHAPLDSIVWRDLSTGDEQTWTFPGAVLDSGIAPPVTAMTLRGEQLVAIVDDRLVTIDVDDPARPDTDAAPEVDEGDRFLQLLGVRPDGRVVALRGASAQSGARVVELDPATGAETEIASYPNHTIASLARNGIDLAVFTDGVLTINGNPIELEGVDPAAVVSIGW